MSLVIPNSKMLREPNLLVPGRKPAGRVKADLTHPFLKDCIGYWPFVEAKGAPINFIDQKTATLVDSGWDLQTIKHDARSDNTYLINDDRLPTEEVTVLLGWKPLSPGTSGHRYCFGTLRSSTNSTTKLTAYLPYESGATYWDFGGTGTNQRLTVSGLSFADDDWAFTAGPAGMYIFQNGIERAANAIAPSARSNSSILGWGLGINENKITDAQHGNYRYVFMFNRQLGADVIRQIIRNPYAPLIPA